MHVWETEPYIKSNNGLYVLMKPTSQILDKIMQDGTALAALY